MTEKKKELTPAELAERNRVAQYLLLQKPGADGKSILCPSFTYTEYSLLFETTREDLCTAFVYKQRAEDAKKSKEQVEKARKDRLDMQNHLQKVQEENKTRYHKNYGGEDKKD